MKLTREQLINKIIILLSKNNVIVDYKTYKTKNAYLKRCKLKKLEAIYQAQKYEGGFLSFFSFGVNKNDDKNYLMRSAQEKEKQAYQLKIQSENEKRRAEEIRLYDIQRIISPLIQNEETYRQFKNDLDTLYNTGKLWQRR